MNFSNFWFGRARETLFVHSCKNYRSIRFQITLLVTYFTMIIWSRLRDSGSKVPLVMSLAASSLRAECQELQSSYQVSVQSQQDQYTVYQYRHSLFLTWKKKKKKFTRTRSNTSSMKGQFKREVVVDQSFQIKSNGLSDAMVPPQLNDVPKTEYHKFKKKKKYSDF